MIPAVWPIGGLIVIVAALLIVGRQDALTRLFRWLPIPLWCYLLPLLAVTFGLLPGGHPAYRALTHHLLPFALALLLLGVDLPVLIRTGARALLAAAIAAAGIAIGVVVWSWILQAHLPPDAWKGAGLLAATWTGGSLNLLAMRALLEPPETIFAPLIIIDAMVAYSWMILLVAASGSQSAINRWLRVDDQARVPTEGGWAPAGRPRAQHSTASSMAAVPEVSTADRAREPTEGGWATEVSTTERSATDWLKLSAVALLALLLALAARWIGHRLPETPLVSSSAGWTVLIVTSGALALSLIAQVRRAGERGAAMGYPCLYLVLAATGAQADLESLRSAPVWIALGYGVMVIHGGLLLASGRLFRIPIGLLATASQSNIGGFVSGPLVGAIYHRSLAPIGLLLAMAGSAFGTYCGLATAYLAKMLLTGR